MATELVVPELGESITEAIVSRWLKKEGEPIEQDEPVVDLETDKVSVQVPAPAAGVLARLNVSEGDTVRVGDVLGSIDEGANGEPTAKEKKDTKPEAKDEAKIDKDQPKGNKRAEAPPPRRQETRAEADAEPAPRKKVRQPTREEREAESAQRKQKRAGRALTPAQRKALREGKAPAARAPSVPPEAPEADAREEVVPMTPLRKTIAARLVEAQQTAAILTTFNEVDMSAVMDLRSRYKEEFQQKHGIKLGFMSFFVKAAIAALKDYPGVNAEIREGNIVYKKHYSIGIAVGSGKGLVVPVLRDADQLGFAEIELGIAELAKKAQTGKLTLDDLKGGTFTISNGGIYGSMLSTPLLNMPQTGILGMHNIIKRPVVVGADDRIEVRPMMYLALSYDHRLVDGREAVSFLIGIKRRIESPERLMFEV